MASAAASPVKQLLGLLEFRRFMGASTLTSLTFGTTRFAAVWAMGDLTDWDPALGLLGVALGMPALLFSPLFGALADRYDRRHVAGASTLAVGTGCAIIAALLATDSMNPVGLGAAAFLVSIPLAGVSPALQAMVPTLAPKAMLMNAVALQNLAMMGSMVVGAFVGGLAITLSGTAMAFAIMAGVTVLAFLQLLRLPAAAGQVGTQTPQAEAPASAGRGGIREGFQYARNDAVVGTLLVMASCLGIGSATTFLFLPELARNELEVSAFAAGLLNAAMSMGLILTAGFLASRTNIARPVKVMSVTFALIGGPGVIAIGLAPVYALALLAVFCWGMGGGIVVTLQRTIIQRRTPDHVMGRVMGLFTLAQFGTFPLGALLGFALAQPLGVRGVFVVAGSIMTVLIVTLAFRLIRLDVEDAAKTSGVAEETVA